MYSLVLTRGMSEQLYSDLQIFCLFKFKLLNIYRNMLCYEQLETGKFKMELYFREDTKICLTWDPSYNVNKHKQYKLGSGGPGDRAH